MALSLGPALANTFVGYYEEKVIFFKRRSLKIFDHEAEADEFLTKLNCLHPSLKFTFEKEKDKCLPFLDVNRTDVGFETSVYWKPTFTGQYLHR